MDASELTDPIHVEDARIVGHLNLDDQKLTRPLILRNCYVEEEISLLRAELPELDLSGSHLWGLNANQARIGGDVKLGGIVTTGSAVDFEDAHIGGSVLLFGATLSNLDGFALDLSHATIAKSVYANADFSSAGMVNIDDTEVGHDIYLQGARFFHPAREALSISFSDVSGIHLSNAVVTGATTLTSTRVRDSVQLDSARFANSSGAALNCRALKVGGDLSLQDAIVRGETVLQEAQATHLLLAGAEFFSTVHAALLTVTGATIANRTLTVHGDLNLDSAQLGEVSVNDAHLGELSLNRTHVQGGLLIADCRTRAVSADSLTVDKTLWCRFRTHTIWAHGLRTGHDAFLRGTADEVVLVDARVSGKLILADTDFAEVDLEGMHASRLNLGASTSPAEIDLTNAVIGVLEDNPKTWPDKLWLRGFQYDVLEHDKEPRLDWLQLDPSGYVPSNYDTLANAYKRAGRVEFARKVLIAKQKHRREEFGRIGRSWNRLLELTVGYGYQTSRAWLWLAGLLAIGTAVYATAAKTSTAPIVQAFNPFVYALDVLLPIVDLGQEKAWVVKGAAQYVSWGLIVAGWVLTTAVVAGLTNALKRD